MFKIDDFVFSYRVAEVLTLNNSKEINENVIDHLFVNEKYQNQGYGKKLLFFAINYLQKSGVKQIILYVADLNSKATELYLNNGFKCINTIKDDWG